MYLRAGGIKPRAERLLRGSRTDARVGTQTDRTVRQIGKLVMCAQRANNELLGLGEVLPGPQLVEAYTELAENQGRAQ